MRNSLMLVLLAIPLLSLSDVAPAEDPGTISLVAVAPHSPGMLRGLQEQALDLVSYDPETGVAYLFVDAGQRQWLSRQGYDVSMVEADVEARAERLLAEPDLGLYHTNAELVQELKELAATYPELARLHVIGESYEGRPIYALKISDDPQREDPSEPDILIVGNHHARELMSVEVPLHLAQYLLAQTARNRSVGDLVRNREIWIVPSLNPDGHVQQEIVQGIPGWRKNRRVNGDGTIGVDLNRNYSVQWGLDNIGSSGETFSQTYRGTQAFSEPETQAMRSLVEAHDFVIALSYHSYGQLLLYPWGWTARQTTEDHAVFVALADSMVRENGYRPGSPFNGAIYLVNGEFDDYLYGEVNARKQNRTFSFTVELNSLNQGGFWPAESLIQPTCDKLLSLNLFAIRIASEDLRSVLPPPVPLLTLFQHEQQPWRLDLEWSLSSTPVNEVDHYEVFEINPLGSAAAKSSRPVELRHTGREVIAQNIRLPRNGQVVLRLSTVLQALWDYVYIEARARGSTQWVALPGNRTTSNNPTGRNSGYGLTVSLRNELATFDASALGEGPIDLSIRLAAQGELPQSAYVSARLDVVQTFSETRRIIAPDVQDTHYTVLAENPGLFGYGVTVVDRLGRKSDSEPIFVSIPAVTDVEVQEVALHTNGREVSLSWLVTSATESRFEAWSRALLPGENPGSLVEEWPSVDWRIVASKTVISAGPQSLQWESSGARSAVLLLGKDSDGTRLWGPWVATTLMRTVLHGAAPNPFNPNTRIRFDLATGGVVQLVIYGVDGRRIRQLTSRIWPAGGHEILWDGRDDSGRQVASGVYMVRLRSGGYSFSQRLVLLR